MLKKVESEHLPLARHLSGPPKAAAGGLMASHGRYTKSLPESEVNVAGVKEMCNTEGPLMISFHLLGMSKARFIFVISCDRLGCKKQNSQLAVTVTTQDCSILRHPELNLHFPRLHPGREQLTSLEGMK